MRTLRLAAVVATIVLGAVLPCGAGEAAASEADIETAVAALASYDSGKPRKPLSDVEQLIRDAHGNAELTRHIEQQLIKALEAPAATDEAKLFICQQLWVVATDASLPALAKMLADEKTSHPACYALGQRPSPKADAALRAALALAKGTALVNVVNLIGDRRDAAAVEAVGKLVASDDPAVAEAALASLGKIGTEPAAKLLAEARKKVADKLRPVANDACLRCAEGLAAKGKREQAIAIYRELFAAGEPKLVRRAALVGLMAVGAPNAAELATGALRGGDPMLKATAIASIRTLKGEGVTERFAADLPKLPPDVQALLIGALADRGDPAARPAIVAAVKAQAPEVRAAALRALGKIGDAASVGVLARAAAEAGSMEEATIALASLRALSGEGVEAALIQAMKAARPPLRATLIEVLHDRNVVEAVPALLDEAAGKDADVRVAAFMALARLAGPEQLPALLKLLVGMKGDEARGDAERAVVDVARKIADEAARADAPLAALGSATAVPARCSLLRVLRGIGNEKAFQAVHDAVGDASPEVQDTAVRELANWPNQVAAGILMSVFETTRSEAHRALALRGFVRLLSAPGRHSPEDRLMLLGRVLTLKKAYTPEEKKLVLAGIAGVGHPAGLKLVEPLLSDEAVAAEAAMAMLSIARTILGSSPADAKAAAVKLLAASKDPAVRKQAEAIIQVAGKVEDYITSWQVAGPYTEAGKEYLQLFDVAFPPERADAKDVAWRVLPSGTDPAQPLMLDLLKAVGGEQCLAYVRTWVQSDKEQKARLELGTDDGNKVWLNGQVVHEFNKGGKAVPGSYQAQVTLRQGWNLLVMKITQATGPWEFCARLRAPDGKRLESIRWDCLHEERK
ncbi:MAG TPA: HEAT repeat domain-containing protein [Planctomycetota bacterium]|nr:HEAT repeat domain-containing protein [Planctomycetota bacterium]